MSTTSPTHIEGSGPTSRVGARDEQEREASCVGWACCRRPSWGGGAVERTGDGRMGAVKRAVVEHAAAVRAQRRGRDVARRYGAVAVEGHGGNGCGHCREVR
jgi:hypothetical protein